MIDFLEGRKFSCFGLLKKQDNPGFHVKNVAFSKFKRGVKIILLQAKGGFINSFSGEGIRGLTFMMGETPPPVPMCGSSSCCSTIVEGCCCCCSSCCWHYFRIIGSMHNTEKLMKTKV